MWWWLTPCSLRPQTAGRQRAVRKPDSSAHRLPQRRRLLFVIQCQTQSKWFTQRLAGVYVWRMYFVFITTAFKHAAQSALLILLQTVEPPAPLELYSQVSTRRYGLVQFASSRLVNWQALESRRANIDILAWFSLWGRQSNVSAVWPSISYAVSRNTREEQNSQTEIIIVRVFFNWLWIETKILQCIDQSLFSVAKELVTSLRW